MEATVLRQKILDIIDERDISSNGKCGVRPAAMISLLEVEYDLIREQLNYLYENGMIKVREGINGYLLFKK